MLVAKTFRLSVVLEIKFITVPTCGLLRFYTVFLKVELLFKGNGYMDFDKKLISYKSGTETTMTIKFSTLEPNGLLLWQGGQLQTFALAGGIS